MQRYLYTAKYQGKTLVPVSRITSVVAFLQLVDAPTGPKSV